MISEHEVATIAKRLTKSRATVSGIAKQAKHEVATGKIEALGMRFGGTELLEKTIGELASA